MNGVSVFVRNIKSNEQWVTPESSTYEDEADLQALLASEPTHIAGVPNGSVAVREMPTSAGPVDICVISPAGEVTVVECKLSKTSEHRRRVLGQVIDYASAIHQGSLKDFEEAWRSRGGSPMDGILEPDGLRILSENIVSGRIHLAVAVDQIDDDLKRLIEYLNKITRDDVMVTALQLTYVRHDGIEILIPSTYGAEIAQTKNPARRNQQPWTWSDFLDALTSPSDRELAEELYQRLTRIPSTGTYDKLWFGNRPGGGIFFQIHGEYFSAFQLWRNSAGTLMVYGNWTNWPKIANDERFSELAQILGQTHIGRSKSVPLGKVDLDRLWEIAVICDRALNPLN